MDSANIRNMLRIFGGDPDGKVRKLMEYTGRGDDVADPWYSNRFDVAYRDILEGCTALFEGCRKINFINIRRTQNNAANAVSNLLYGTDA